MQTGSATVRVIGGYRSPGGYWSTMAFLPIHVGEEFTKFFFIMASLCSNSVTPFKSLVTCSLLFAIPIATSSQP